MLARLVAAVEPERLAAVPLEALPGMAVLDLSRLFLALRRTTLVAVEVVRLIVSRIHRAPVALEEAVTAQRQVPLRLGKPTQAVEAAAEELIQALRTTVPPAAPASSSPATGSPKQSTKRRPHSGRCFRCRSTHADAHR